MNIRARILVVEDDPSQREELTGFLRDMGAEVREAENGRAALEILAAWSPDLCITDYRMPHMDGGELLDELHRLNPEIPVILVTAFGTVQGAVAALKKGATDYLMKPLDLGELEHLVRRALDERNLLRENRELKARLARVEAVPGIITTGGPMNEVLSMVSRVAGSDVSVVLQGESGTGKELVARAIHAAGPRAELPFVAVNASALSVNLLESELFGHEKGSFTGAEKARIGRFEAASGGTVFLDEIGDLPLEVQIKLLRVLQERTVERVGSSRPVPVDVRVVAATHRDLQAAVDKGIFREDLYYRLAVVRIDLPPLRNRKADIPKLVEHFLQKHGACAGESASSISREAMDLLIAYDFPGNVRELENVIQGGMVMARTERIQVDDLPPSIIGSRSELGGSDGPGQDTLPGKLEQVEKEAIAEAMALENGVQSRAARRLGISERALRYKVVKYRLKP